MSQQFGEMKSMSNPIVRFVKIKPMRAAVFNAISKTPETQAHEARLDWAGPKGLLEDPSTYLLFGRNNPPPTPGQEEYGYDCLITVSPDIKVEDDVQVQEIAGGLYAVVRTNLTNIGDRWEWLYHWLPENGYKIAGHGLEELLCGDESAPDKFLLDLWLPIAE